MRFKWDPRKAAINKRVHGVSFEIAQEVFEDPHDIAADNYVIASDGEQRYQVIGMTHSLVLLLVVFVDRSEPGGEIIHIISARKAVGYEESIYEESICEDQFR